MQKLIFLGQRQIAWNALVEIAKPENREHLRIVAMVSDHATCERFRAESDGGEIVFVENDRRRTQDILSAIRKTGATGLLSIQHNWILSEDVLAAVGGWAFNLHNARLPHYQGYNSISHAIINGDSEFVSTIHWMTDKVDEGDLAYEEVTPIDGTDTALTLHRKTIDAAGRAFGRFLSDVRNARPIPRYAPPDAPRRFYGKSDLHGLLDVSSEADPAKLDRLSRGLFYPPHNAAYRMVGERKIYQIPESGLVDLVDIGLR
ncbi:formyltransferase family protein [uncultured Alsobacter sp.]|uniref:formyltransferase family protein n=1 Tax=uncultured Alsobacter sp. TaxID=1748258 RepID=UPI0025DB34F5|nr:formyltransferase family protein [uncultured Alsobacter sp.]